jgi:hypothetical protein
MSLTTFGKIFILVLIMAFGFGAYTRLQKGPNTVPATPPSQYGGTRTGNNGSNTNVAPITTPASTGQGQKGEVPPANTEGEVEIPFVITAAKRDWVGDQVKRFNAANTGKYRVVTEPIPSREAMISILEGRTKPVLWSPGSPIWPARLSQAWKEKNGNNILDLNNPNGYRVFLRSPLVFLTTRDKAKFLRPLLGGPSAWENLRKLSSGQMKTPFGPLNFSHADPLTSSSGMLTLGLILYDYGQRSGQAGDFRKLARDAKFWTYMAQLERGLIYDVPAEKGTTALTNAFIENPGRYDFITAYESAALVAAEKNPNLAVIYPSPTAVSEHALSLLSGSWVSPQQRAGAEAFITFLGGSEPLRDGVKSRFRPAVAGDEISLAPVLAQHAAQGFQQSFAPIDLPPYQALNDAAYQWRVKIAKQAP